MPRSPSLRVLAVVLAFALAANGCALPCPSRRDHVAARCASLATLSGSAGSEGISDETCGPEASAAEGLLQVRHRHHGAARAAIIAGVCLIFVFVVIADLVILAYTIPHHCPFCCTARVIDWCR